MANSPTTFKIGVLYESDEWSDHKLAAEIERATQALATQDSAPVHITQDPAQAHSTQSPTDLQPTYEVQLIDMQQPDCIQEALSCDLLVSRVFASATFRGHDEALVHMDELISKVAAARIPLLNEGRAHAFEIDKQASNAALEHAGLHVPKIFACGLPDAIQLPASKTAYPCVIKPNCGGRTTYTTIAHSPLEAAAFLEDAPRIEFLAQEYIRPSHDYLTRVEIVDGEPVLVVKRSVAPNGLSAYHLGSTYELYPDCPTTILDDARKAAATLGFTFGSFDIIETEGDDMRSNAPTAFFIDANSVSNVSEDCTDIFGMDLMRVYGEAIANLIAHQRTRQGGTMLSIKEVYELFDTIGCCSFATLDGQGGVDSRIAHFFAYDEEGLYLRTMTGKPFYRQLVEGGKLSVCGEHTAAPCEWDEDNMPHFQPGFMARVSGDVRVLTSEEVAQRAATNPHFNVAIYDMNKYPETVVLVLDRAWGELYDYDFNMVNRDHKLLRERFAWGGAEFVAPGFHITDDCIACGSCASACTHKAIVPGNPYSILGERCDECGNCHNVCPVGAVVEKGLD